MTPGLDHGGSGCLPERRAEPARADADVVQGVDRRLEICPYPTRSPEEMMLVAKSVRLYLMSPIADFAYQLWVRLHMLAQTEEGRGQGELIQPLEDMRGRAWVRPVVERQCHPISVRTAPPTEIIGQDPDRQPLSETDHAGHHVRAGEEGNRGQSPSRTRPPVW